jgi:zinc protease
MDYVQFALPNQLPVVCVHRPGAKTFAAVLGFRAGFRDEPPGNDGIAHLVEHLSFRTGNGEAVQALGRKGVFLNAMTGWEQTMFYAGGHASLIGDCVTFLRGVVCGIAHDADSIRAETEILAHEYAGQNPAELQTAHQFNNVISQIIGDPSLAKHQSAYVRNLGRLRPDAIEQFHSRFYAPANAFLAVVSPQPADVMRPIIEQHLGDVPARSTRHAPTRQLNPRPVKLLRVWRYPGSQVFLQVIYHFRPLDRFPYSAVATVCDFLGGGQHSFLFQNIRQQGRMGYNVGSFLNNFTDCAFLGASALVHKRYFAAALGQIIHEFDRLRAEGLPSPQFEDTRLRLIRSFDNLEDNPFELCSFLAYENTIAAGRPIRLPEDYRSHLGELTAERLNDVTRELLRPENRVVLLTGAVGLLNRWRARRMLKQSLQS